MNDLQAIHLIHEMDPNISYDVRLDLCDMPVVLIPGSHGLLENLDIGFVLPKRSNGVWLHGGVAWLAGVFFADLLRSLPHKPAAFCGYSLGAVIAQALAARWPYQRCRDVAFEPPAAAYLDSLPRELERCSTGTAYVHANDPVPLQPPSWAGYRQARPPRYFGVGMGRSREAHKLTPAYLDEIAMVPGVTDEWRMAV